jgi:hypothetical protein
VLANQNLAEIPMHRKVPSIPFGRRLAMLLGLAVIVAGLALFVSVVGAVSHDVRSLRLDAATIGAPRSEAVTRDAVTSVYIGVLAFTRALGWTRVEPEEWMARVGLRSIGAGVIFHVAIGHRRPFAFPEESRGEA